MGRVRMLISFALLTVFLLAVSGCANRDPDPVPVQQAVNTVNAEKAIMDDFTALISRKGITVAESISFIDKNIKSVSGQNASLMVIALEKMQRSALTSFEEKFSSSDWVQQEMTKNYRNGLSDSTINAIANTSVKEILLETRNSGFKVETAEGMYFPVIDYSLYAKYRNSVTPDIAAYIEIMAVESDKAAAKDAALMLSWQQIIDRALRCEKFISEYSTSAKRDDIRSLLKKYIVFSFYGANNTPLFSYETTELAPEARKTYSKAEIAGDGIFSTSMRKYISLLKENDFRLTPEVEAFRASIIREFQQ